MLLNVVHININVSDIERSIAFYEKLGFKVMHVFGDGARAEIDPGKGVRAGMDSGGGRRVRGAVLSISDDPRASTKLELLEWVEPPTEPRPGPSQHSSGVSRIAIRTKNLRAYVEKLRGDGIEFETDVIDTDVVGAKCYVLFRDPDGTLLELIEF